MNDQIAVCIYTFCRNQMLGPLLVNIMPQETDGPFQFFTVVYVEDRVC